MTEEIKPRLVVGRGDGHYYNIAPAISRIESFNIDDDGKFDYYCTGRTGHKLCIETGKMVLARMLVFWRKVGDTQDGCVQAATLCYCCFMRWSDVMSMQSHQNRFIEIHYEKLQLLSSESVGETSSN